MITENQAQSPREWAVEHFGGVELSDVRRVDRAITIAEALAASPGVSLPQMFAHPYDLNAAYKFFRHPEATPDNLQAGHRDLVLCEMEKPGRYLMLADTSEVLCTKTGEIIGLGPVGASKDAQIGFHLHSVWPSAGHPHQIRLHRAARPWRFWAWLISNSMCGSLGRRRISPMLRCERFSHRRLGIVSLGEGFAPPARANAFNTRSSGRSIWIESTRTTSSGRVNRQTDHDGSRCRACHRSPWWPSQS